jgi:GNAT superfamily N-acetyltransferase
VALDLDIGPRLRATPSELHAVYGLIEESSAWLRDKGLAQWNPVYPFERFSREVEQGHVWYWTSRMGPTATVTLLEQRPNYYPDEIWNDDVAAWYVCRFAVTRKLLGTNVGSRLLLELEHAAAIAGRRALRLDVTASNSFLERYYATRGFRRIAVADVRSERSVFLEKTVSTFCSR